MAIPTGPLSGFTTGQILGEVLQDRQSKDKKAKRRQNIALGVTTLLGLGDATLQAKHNKIIDTLDKSKVTDIAKSSKMYDDALELQTVQESIDSYGGGLDGALVHYDSEAELAFNVKHRPLLEEFEKTSAGRAKKDEWKRNFIKDNLYKKHELEYVGADAKRISGLSREEFNKPVEQFYTAKFDEANNPANKSIVHKGLSKGAELLGFDTKADKIRDEIVSAEIGFNARNNKINQYRNLFSNTKVEAPSVYTRNTIEALPMRRTEFFDSWFNDDNLDNNFAEYAYQEFEKTGKTLKDYQTQALAYLTDKSNKDTEVIKNQARAKAEASPDYNDLSSEEQKLRKNIAVIEALGGDGRNMKLQAETMAAVNELIARGEEGYELIADDPTTTVNETEERRQLLYANTWAKVKRQQLSKLTGDIDVQKEQANFITQSSVLLFNDIRDKEPRVMEGIKTTQVPTGTTELSKMFGEGAIQNIIEQRFADTPNADNSARRAKINEDLLESNFSLQQLSEGTDAYNLLLEAQTKYYISQQNQNIVEGSFVYAAGLKELIKPIQ
tara:strand:+ start:1219 stop:2883 length:1665 start_codon:yes stop_codon:yes gene_type:complete